MLTAGTSQVKCGSLLYQGKAYSMSEKTESKTENVLSEDELEKVSGGRMSVEGMHAEGSHAQGAHAQGAHAQGVHAELGKKAV